MNDTDKQIKTVEPITYQKMKESYERFIYRVNHNPFLWIYYHWHWWFWNEWNPRELYRKTKNTLQRAFRGYGYRDIWSLDTYLSRWLPQALRDLAITSHGHPVEFKEYEDWQKELNHIADLIDAMKELDELDFGMFGGDLDKYKEKQNELLDKRNEGLQLLIKYWDNLWD